MAEAMLDCTLCGGRKGHSLGDTKARDLKHAGATRLPCPICGRETFWVYAQYDRRESRDRRALPEQAMAPLITKPSVKPPPDKQFFRQAAIGILESERRASEDRRQEIQRNHLRVPLQLPVKVRVNTMSLRFEEVTLTTNVCKTGLHINSNLPYAKGILAYVTLNYSDAPGGSNAGSNIEQRGIVVRIDPDPKTRSKGVAIQLQ